MKKFFGPAEMLRVLRLWSQPEYRRSIEDPKGYVNLRSCAGNKKGKLPIGEYPGSTGPK
jgi:hypothetical protein